MIDAKELREIIQGYNEEYDQVVDDIVERLLKKFISALDIIKSSNKWSLMISAYKVGFFIQNQSCNGDFESLTFNSTDGIRVFYSEEEFEDIEYTKIEVEEFFDVNDMDGMMLLGYQDEDILFCKPIIKSFIKRGFSCYIDEDNTYYLLVVLDLAR